jgi:RHS repeat-associated protein
MLIGHINKSYGSLVLEGEPELDFVLDAPLPLAWQRSYTSNNPDSGWLGRGWTLPLNFRIEVEPAALGFVDAFGRRTRFPMLAVGDCFFSPYEHTTLSRPQRNLCELLTPDGLRLVFGLGPQAAAEQGERDAEEARTRAEFQAAVARLAQQQGLDPAALSAGSTDQRPPQADTLYLIGLIDPNGHWLRVHYTPDGLPQVIETSDGQHVGLNFRHDIAGNQTRLSEVIELIGAPDAAGRFAASTRLIEYRYSAQGDLTEVVDEQGQVVRTFRYAAGQMIEQGEPGGVSVQYDWDQLSPKGRVTEAHGSLGELTRFEYNEAEHSTRVIDASGRVTVYRYDADQHLIALIAPDGSETRYLRDIHGNLLSHTDPLGRVTRHSYDGRGNLIRVEQADGADWNLRYHPQHRKPVQITDPLGQRSEFEFDARGNLIQTRSADGAITRYTLDAQGRPVHVLDARGGESILQFDAAGRLISRRDCVGSTTRFEYDRRGNLLRVTDALGGITHYQYQRLNRRDRVVAMTHPDGAVERFAYDPLGRLIAHHDPQGHATRYHLDPAGRPIARENALGHRLAYQYDRHGRLATLTNENGALYRFGWDSVDRLISEQGFDARRLDYRYNAAGELIESADGVPYGAEWMAPQARGVLRSHYQRDAMGRLLEKVAVRVAESTGSNTNSPAGARAGAGAAATAAISTKPTNRTTRARYAYSRTGLLVQARNAQARIELAYTPTGRLAHETTRARDGREFRISHRYDGLGNRIETVLPDGRVLKPELYGSGHVAKLKLDGEVITEFERDALHRETVRTQGALRSFFERDAAGRLIRQFVRPTERDGGGSGVPTPEPKIARHYHYDRSGQLLGIDDQRSGRSLYRYDATGRLLAAQGPLGVERFAFDPASNLLDPNQPQNQAPGSQKTWTEAEWAEYVREHIHDPNFNPLLTPEQRASDPSQWGEAKPNRLTVYGEHRYRYDTWGNTVEKRSGGHQRMRLHWDAEHQLRLICVERGEGINRAGAELHSAANDAANARTERSVNVPSTLSAGVAAQPSGTTREHWAYDYDPFGRRIAKYPISEAAARAWIEHGDEAALARALKAPQPHTVGLDPPTPHARNAHAQAVNPTAPTLFCWDGNRLLAEHNAGTHQLYLYEPDSFVPLAIVRWKAANEDSGHARGTDSGARVAIGSKHSTRAGTPSTANTNDTDRDSLLPPELLSLKERYPQQWAKLEAQRRKLARQLGQSPEPEAPTPPKPEVFHLHVDHLGTPREITDTDGHLVWTANYAAWGKAVTANPPRRILTRQGNTVAEVIEEQAEPLQCNLRFQGQYADAESGLHYNRFRYYEPEVGRFASQDPISLLGGDNLYRYAFNPTNWTDPLGLSPCVARQVGRTRIIGTGQVTSAGHDQLSELIANKLAMSGKFTEVYINRAYSTATGSQTVPRRLPDLIGIDSTGKAHAIEIPSPSDITRNRPLAQRNQAAMRQLPCGIQGTVTVLGYPYSAASIKAQIDALIGAVP